MKIVYLSTNITGSGGVARVTADKANYFVEKWDHEVFIISTNDKNPKPFYDFNSRIKFHFIATRMSGVSSLLTLYKQINKLLTSIKPDIVLINDNGIKAYFAPFLIRVNAPMLLEVHGAVRFSFQKTHSRLKSTIISKWIDFSTRHFDKIILLNNESKSEWKTSKVAVIPNFVIINPQVNPVIKQNKIIAIGRICRQKGYDRMLAIWERVVAVNPDWSLHIYGKVEDQVLYNQLNSKKREQVYFYGESSEVLSKFQEVDFFIHTAYFEGMPMVLLETMAHGVTGVVFDAPFGIKEIVSHEWNGLVVKDNNETEFVQQVQRLIDDTNLRNRLRSNTQQSVLPYSKERVMPLWEQLLQKYKNK